MVILQRTSWGLKLFPVEVPTNEGYWQFDISAGIGFRYVHKGSLMIPTTSQMGSPFVSINTFKPSSMAAARYIALFHQALFKLALYLVIEDLGYCRAFGVAG